MANGKKGAQERGATLAFLDESGFSLRPSVRRTWAPRGQTPTIRHKFNWKRLHAIGTITCRADGTDPDLLLHLQEQSVKEDALIAFVNDLHQQVQGPVVLLWDGLPAHRSKRVQAHIQANSDWLSVVRFPGYAPELNPVEYLWSSIKGKHVANACPDTLEQLQRPLLAAHAQIQEDESLLVGFLKASSLF